MNVSQDSLKMLSTMPSQLENKSALKTGWAGVGVTTFKLTKVAAAMACWETGFLEAQGSALRLCLSRCESSILTDAQLLKA